MKYRPLVKLFMSECGMLTGLLFVTDVISFSQMILDLDKPPDETVNRPSIVMVYVV